MKLCGFDIGLTQPFFLIAGPCVIESEQLQMDTAGTLKEITSALGIPFIFKSSFDKANRSSIHSYRGPGLKEGLRILASIRAKGIPVLTDIHESAQIPAVAKVCDVLQIPAFLCRQTDLILAAAETGRVVNVKKGQFLAPWDVKNIADKLKAAGNERFFFTERGASFGYNALVADMRSLYWIREQGYRVVFDATHSVQRPGGLGGSTGGDGHLAPVLARAAVAAGCDGIFMETHVDPSKALSDGPNQVPLSDLGKVLRTLRSIHELVTP